MSDWGDTWGMVWGCPVTPATDDDPCPKNIEDICEQWLWWQYDRAPNMRALCRILAKRFGEIDQQTAAITANRGLNQMQGGELDAWGVMVGVERNGVGDVLMRRKIQAAARAAFGQGQPVDFYEVMTLIAPESNPRFVEVFPACVRMFFDAVSNEERRIIFELMRPVLTSRDEGGGVPALGVCMQYVEIPDDIGELFQWSYLENEGDPPPRQLFPVKWHWDFFPDRDIPDARGWAFLVE